MRASQLTNILGTLLPNREPVLIVGSPGIGKTSVVEQACERMNYDIMIMHPVVDDPTDYKGMPAIIDRGEEKSAAFLPFGNLWHMIEAQRPTVVMFDDIGQALPATQAAMMQLLLARSINGKKISDHVTFVAATNRRQDQAAVTGLITPLLDRFTTVLNLDYDTEDWVKWAAENKLPAVLLAFARFRADLMNQFEANRDMKKSATPRSVAGLGRLLAQGVEDAETLSGAAGNGFATEFLAFYRTYKDLPDIKEIYKNPDKAPVPTKIDVTYALMGALAHHAKKENFSATCKYLNRMKPEFSVLCMKDTVMRHKELQETSDFVKWAMAHKHVFSETR